MPGENAKSIFDDLPKYRGGAPETHLYICNDCGIPSRSTRSYTLLTIIFLLFVGAWRRDTLMKCPRCMRLHILKRLPLAILLANLFSPIVVAWWLVVFLKTFGRYKNDASLEDAV